MLKLKMENSVYSTYVKSITLCTILLKTYNYIV